MIQMEVMWTTSIGGIHEMIVAGIEDQKIEEMVSMSKLRDRSIIQPMWWWLHGKDRTHQGDLQI